MHIYTYRRMLGGSDDDDDSLTHRDLPSSSSMKKPAGTKHLSTHRLHFRKWTNCSWTLTIKETIYFYWPKRSGCVSKAMTPKDFRFRCPVNCREFIPEKKMVPRPKRISAARMHLLTEKPLSSCCRGSWNSSSLSSSSSALPIRSRDASRDLLLLSCGPTSPAAFRGSCSPPSVAAVASEAVKTNNNFIPTIFTSGTTSLFHFPPECPTKLVPLFDLTRQFITGTPENILENSPEF